MHSKYRPEERRHAETSVSYPLFFICVIFSLLSVGVGFISGSWVWTVAVTFMAIVLFLLLFQIHITIDRVAIQISYGVGLLSRTIELAHITNTAIEANDKALAWFYQPFRDGCLVLTLRGGSRVALPVREQRKIAEMLRVKDR